MREINRRDFMKLAGLGGVIFASALQSSVLGNGDTLPSTTDDFHFVQLSDTHWGF